MARQTKNQKKRSFHQELVLNRWVLGFFHGGTLAALKMRLGDDRFEGIDRKSTRLNSSHLKLSRMPSSA